MLGLSHPREIALFLVLAAIILSAGAWALRSVVPGAEAWLVDRASHAALDIGLVVILMAIGLWSWLSHRNADGRVR
ncbi:hypothetical protein Q8W71_04615 [Methylobacterium sp. NEAU 140]|uniref:hypothetical protein n=1 Tax=Methylobacterium sp. NEAU 140 TaxID=3064945 RepID=UPI00273321AF|nr:hypothetical protein [Methylobacterium sp. NEAU 140]MDP4021900.1 hypothetical protein [Methylobacterium sp. NEAU 140]